MIATTADVGSFYVGDKPSLPAVLSLATEDNLTAYTSVTVAIVKPDGTAGGTGTGTLTAGEDDGYTVTVPWPDDFTFDDTGIYRLNVSLAGTGTTLRLTAVRIVSQIEDGWHTLESAREQWPDADMDDVPLYELLQVTRSQCTVYAPALALGAAVPVNYRAAQLKQAQNIWNGSKVDTGGVFPEQNGSIPVFPMDWQVTNLLRPKTAIPVF